jgi:hypothetical protein
MRTIEYGLVILEGRSGVGRDRFGDQDGGEEENKRRLPVQIILAAAGSSVAQTVVYCLPVHPYDLCMYIRYIYLSAQSTASMRLGSPVATLIIPL